MLLTISTPSMVVLKYTYTNAHTIIHLQTHINTEKLTYTQIVTLPHTHTHTHTHPHTHRHTHTLVRDTFSRQSLDDKFHFGSDTYNFF